MKALKLIIITFFVIGLASCNNDKTSSNENSDVYDLKSSQELLNTMTHDKNYKIMKGSFQVWQTEANEIVLLNSDLSTKNLLILQGASSKTEISLGNYEALYLKHSLLLQNLDTKERVYLKVPKPEEKKITEHLKKQIPLGKVIEGYGLIFGTLDMDNKKLSNLDVVKSQNSLVDYLSQVYQESRGDCGDGGEGSSSCSNSHCSVSCKDGYYACCNYNCHCNRDQIDPT